MNKAQQLKDYLGCDNAFLQELIAGFLKESEETIENIEQAMKTGDNNTVARSAHKLLSSTKILKLDELSQHLEQLEELARNTSKKPDIDPLVNKVKARYANDVKELHDVNKQL